MSLKMNVFKKTKYPQIILFFLWPLWQSVVLDFIWSNIDLTLTSCSALNTTVLFLRFSSWLCYLRTAVEPTQISISNSVSCCCKENALASCWEVCTAPVFVKRLVLVWLEFKGSAAAWSMWWKQQCVCSHQLLQASTDDLIRNLSFRLACLWLDRSLSCSVQSARK